MYLNLMKRLRKKKIRRQVLLLRKKLQRAYTMTRLSRPLITKRKIQRSVSLSKKKRKVKTTKQSCLLKISRLRKRKITFPTLIKKMKKLKMKLKNKMTTKKKKINITMVRKLSKKKSSNIYRMNMNLKFKTIAVTKKLRKIIRILSLNRPFQLLNPCQIQHQSLTPFYPRLMYLGNLN